mmetsp:Transcript_9151/g.10300  ORF Transcript_9151/g.10300 Transcript_9151/m.10300 type:complete len:497 (-) Transcript_9151:202-1692(-)|eukprot:CAMPEP_0176467662 /NCGR_PEP_ID=MMETSP0127-20121128/38585_1 /TAXON_ID=938130 /ORGANISM="Platyophrya macrostoma, Strain WH" /LENGTH=496 /DNA_ID=CAMNT_0017860991 /DNA_START=36 /DNA_END=1526 /DNA_ORIENTATION=+
MLKQLFKKSTQKSLFGPLLARKYHTGGPNYYIEQMLTGCLSEYAYYIDSKGEALIIDPIRESEPYVLKVKEREAKLKYVLETHFHADFISGHLDLAQKTGATIVYGPNATPSFKSHIAKDGEEIKLGDITLQVLHTPGHTLESSCFLLKDSERKPKFLFTGDTLFLGEVGRPDLAVKSELTKEDLAELLYKSLREKIMTLPDDVIIFPGHGAGSSCGKNIQAGGFCSIGTQKKNNYALQPMSKEKFVEIVTSNLGVPPQYFFHDAHVNKSGYAGLEDVMEKNLRALSLEKFKKEMERGTIVLDCRTRNAWDTGFIKGSIFISLSDVSFATWVGTLLKPTDRIAILAEPGDEEEAITRLARVGYENVAGFLDGGIKAWVAAKEQLDKAITVQPSDIKNDIESKKLKILDVRNLSEWENGVIPGAQLISLKDLNDHLSSIPRNEPLYVHCRSGVRSRIAFSLLRRAGFNNLINVEGGSNELSKVGVKFENYKPSTPSV